jgi:hypothetical protein
MESATDQAARNPGDRLKPVTGGLSPLRRSALDVQRPAQVAENEIALAVTDVVERDGR